MFFIARSKRSDYYQSHKDLWQKYRSQKVSKYPLYAVWHGILVRTGVRPGAKDHEIRDYINKGITVCDEWRDYKTFENWCLANGWKSGLDIDRIDNAKGYCPENCRFVTRSQNQRNRKCNVIVECNGERILLIELWEREKCEFPYKLVLHRVKKCGWDPIAACRINPSIRSINEKRHQREMIKN